MVVAIHQPNFLPWPGYFYKIAYCDVFVFLDTVQFTKNGFQNRNRIKTPQGVVWVTVPVLTKGKFGQPTNEAVINNRIDWGTKIWKTIQQNYRKARYFDLYAQFFKEIFSKKWELLTEFNETILLQIMAWLNLSTQTIRASEINVSGMSSELLVNICKELKADTYLSGFGGRKYMEKSLFENKGIRLKTYDFVPPIYPQIHGEFIPNLSVIDLIFNCGPESQKFLLAAGNKDKE